MKDEFPPIKKDGKTKKISSKKRKLVVNQPMETHPQYAQYEGLGLFVQSTKISLSTSTSSSARSSPKPSFTRKK